MLLKKEHLKLILSFSMATFTGILTLAERGDLGAKVASVIISFVGIYVFLSKSNVMTEILSQNVNKNLVYSIVLSFFSVVIIKNRFYPDWCYYYNKITFLPEKWQGYIFMFALLAASLAICIYYSYFIKYIKKYVVNGIINTLTNEEKKFLYGFVGIMSIIIIYAHMHTSAFDYSWWLNEKNVIESVSYDAIMDCDSPHVQYSIHNFDYNFRHPFWSFVAMPEYVVSKMAATLFVHKDAATMMIFSLFQMIKLGLAGICLSRLTKSMLTLFIWYTSYPVILYSIVIERHTWMTFWNLLIVYLTIQNKNQNEDYMPVYQAGGANLIGVMITPIIIKFLNTKDFIIKGMRLAVNFLFIIICTGNLTGLFRIVNDVIGNSKFVDNTSIFNNLKRFTIAIKSSFGGIEVIYGEYTTMYDETGFSYIGIILILATIIAIGYLWDNRFAKMCAYWVSVSVILFPLIGFSQYDYSMHMILFSWAYISLLVMFIKKISVKIASKPIKEAIVIGVGVFLLWQLTTNLTVLNELLSYAARFNYIR